MWGSNRASNILIVFWHAPSAEWYLWKCNEINKRMNFIIVRTAKKKKGKPSNKISWSKPRVNNSVIINYTLVSVALFNMWESQQFSHMKIVLLWSLFFNSDWDFSLFAWGWILHVIGANLETEGISGHQEWLAQAVVVQAPYRYYLANVSQPWAGKKHLHLSLLAHLYSLQTAHKGANQSKWWLLLWHLHLSTKNWTDTSNSFHMSCWTSAG